MSGASVCDMACNADGQWASLGCGWGGQSSPARVPHALGFRKPLLLFCLPVSQYIHKYNIHTFQPGP